MEKLEEAGFGSLEIIPIYGVKDYEDQALLFQCEAEGVVINANLMEKK